MKRPIFAFPPLKGGKPAPAPAAPAKAPKAAPAPVKGVKQAPKPQASPSRRVEASLAGGRVGGRLPPKTTKEPAAPPAPERTLPLRAVTTGQDLPPTPPARCPDLLTSHGKVTGKEMFKFEGDDVWHSSPADAGRDWLTKYRAYFPVAAKLLQAELIRLEAERAAAEMARLEAERAAAELEAKATKRKGKKKPVDDDLLA